MTELEHIKQLAGNLTPAEKEILANYLVEAKVDQPSSEKPQSLRGDWLTRSLKEWPEDE